MRDRKEISFTITLSLERDREILSWYHSISQDEREKILHEILKDYVARRSREELREEMKQEIFKEIFSTIEDKLNELAIQMEEKTSHQSSREREGKDLKREDFQGREPQVEIKEEELKEGETSQKLDEKLDRLMDNF